MAENTAGAKAGKKSGSSSEGESAFDMDELRELMELVTEQGFTEFEFENENIRVRLSKAAAFAPIAQSDQTQAISPVSSQPHTGTPVQTDAPTLTSDADE